MISILIPVHNYNIQGLISKLLIELSTIEYDYEIICLDDCSNIPILNETIISNKVKVLKNKTNIGRTETRQKLANNAKYDWLLFLDADVIPKTDFFIRKYLQAIKQKDFGVCFGGFEYYSKKPSDSRILRWKYGRLKESISVSMRIEKPYKTIISANLLIKKEVFKNINNLLIGNYYGYDNVFSIKLKQRRITVLHIENPVFHLGLEENETYLRKKELAAETIYNAYKNNEISKSDNGLLRTFFILNFFYLIGFVSIIFKWLQNSLKKNLLSSNPSIFLLNCYRIGYFCSLKYHN